MYQDINKFLFEITNPIRRKPNELAFYRICLDGFHHLFNRNPDFGIQILELNPYSKSLDDIVTYSDTKLKSTMQKAVLRYQLNAYFWKPGYSKISIVDEPNTDPILTHYDFVIYIPNGLNAVEASIRAYINSTILAGVKYVIKYN
jgi:hypothetical protein